MKLLTVTITVLASLAVGHVANADQPDVLHCVNGEYLYPADTSPDAACLNYDPCTGETTMWTFAPCDLGVWPAEPRPTLPSTGLEHWAMAAVAALLVVAGVALRETARRA